METILNFLLVVMLVITIIFTVVATIWLTCLAIEDVFAVIEYIRQKKSEERLKQLFERGKKNGKE